MRDWIISGVQSDSEGKLISILTDHTVEVFYRNRESFDLIENLNFTNRVIDQCISPDGSFVFVLEAKGQKVALSAWAFEHNSKSIKSVMPPEEIELMNRCLIKMASVPDGTSVYLAQENHDDIMLYKGHILKLNY